MTNEELLVQIKKMHNEMTKMSMHLQVMIMKILELTSSNKTEDICKFNAELAEKVEETVNEYLSKGKDVVSYGSVQNSD